MKDKEKIYEFWLGQAINRLGTRYLKEELTKIHVAYRRRKNKNLALSLVVLLSTLSIVALVAYHGYKKNSAPKNLEYIAMSHFEHLPMSIRERGRDNEGETMGQVYAFYENENYSQVVMLLGDLETGDYKIELMKGISLIGLKKPEEAIPILEKLLVVRLIQAEATWYLSLAYLQSNRKQEAIKYLEELASSGQGSRSGDALHLIKEVKTSN